MNHIWDNHRAVCLKCGRMLQEVFDRGIECDGELEYREWLRGGTFVQEPIVRKRFARRRPT